MDLIICRPSFYINNAVAVDGLSTEGAGASVAMTLTYITILRNRKFDFFYLVCAYVTGLR